MTSRQPQAVTLRATTLTFLVLVMGGQYSLDRLGVRDLGWLDLRLVGLGMGCALLAYETTRPRGPERLVARSEGWLIAAALLFLLQVASGLWAPRHARVGEQAGNVVIMGIITIGFYLHARRDALVVAERTLWFLVAVGLLFAAAAVAAGPGAQGRFSALGGGPNVFVRFQVLGAVAAVALVSIGASRMLLTSLPVFAVSAVLSGSRGGLLAAGVAGGLALALGGPRLRRAAIPAAAAVALVLAASAIAVPAVGALLQSRFVQQTGGQVYTSGRPEIWAETLALAGRHPFQGVGLDGYYGLAGSQTGVEYPHNYVLAITAESGAGALLLLVVAAGLWVATVRAGNWRGVHCQAMVLCTCFIATASLTSGDYYDTRLMWIFAAVAAAVARSSAALDTDTTRVHPLGSATSS